MAAMNAGGGAFGGIPLMNNGTNGATSRAGSDQGEIDLEARLNAFIYDFFLKSENYSSARSLLDSGVPMDPNLRDKEPNGTDDNMRSDSKDDVDSKRPDDLPTLTDDPTSFLLDWFSCFWDFWSARQSNSRASTQAMSFLAHTQSRIRQEREQHMLRGTPGGMMPGGMEGFGQMMRLTNGIPMNADLRHKAMRNSYGQPSQQQLAQQFANKQQQQQQMMAQQHSQLRRDPPDLDMNGRPRTPSLPENAPSPSKRPRLEGVPFNSQQMMHNGRGPPHGLPGQPMIEPSNSSANILLHSGIDPKNLSQTQLNQFQQQTPQVQHKSIQVYAQNMQRQQRPNMPKPGMPGQGSDMMQVGMDLANTGAGPEYFNTGLGLRATIPAPSSAGGNHALQDYQMQLMLLEQQNKKRLLMARQEQDNGARPEGQPGMPGAPNYAPGMSPSGSRSGPSPGPNEQMKRGTPKMGQAGLPGGGSPMPDGSMPPSRDSPAAMSYNGQITDMYQLKMSDGMGAMGPNGMRPPPSSHPPYNRQMTIEAVQRQGVGQMQNGAWPSGQTPIMQQQIPQTPQPSQGTPQQRGMPPPTAPPTGATSNGRPASPAQPPAPPTPLPAPKANPKAKKNDEKTRKRPPKTKATTTSAATPAPAPADTENPPPTPTPATPSTPSHPSSFSNKNDGQHANNMMQAPIPAATSAPIAQSQPEPTFVGLDGTDNGYEMGNFSADMSGDVLENFDFDSFLQSTDDGGFNFDPAALTFASSDAVEAGGGDA